MELNTLILYTNEVKKVATYSNKASMFSDVIIVDGVNKYVTIVLREERLFTTINKTVTEIKKGHLIKGDLNTFLVPTKTKTKTYSIVGVDLIKIANDEISNIKHQGIPEDNTLYISNLNNELLIYHNENIPVYHNNVILKEDLILASGDVIDVLGVEITFNNKNLEITDYVSMIDTINLIPVENYTSLKQVEAYYQRSPRIIYNSPDDDLVISNPPNKEKANSESLIKIIVPPLLMVSITIVMSIVLKRGPYVFMAMATSALSITMSVSNYFNQKKQIKVKNIKRVEVYHKYLQRKLFEIRKAINEQEFSLNYHYPSNEKILDMLLDYSSRMYEKAPLNHDFLHVRIALANLDYSFKIKFDEKDFSAEEDDLFDEAKVIKNRFTKSELLPKVISLSNGAVGLVGHEKLVNEQFALLINQIAFFHSYHDVEIINVFKEEDYEYFKAFAFLPHLNSKIIHARGNVYSKKSQDQVLNSFYQVVKARNQQYLDSAKGGDLSFSPAFILNVIDMKQIIDHSIMEFLSHDVSHLGIHVIYGERSLKNLPEHVNSIIEFKNHNEGRIINIDKEYVNERIIIDHNHNFDYEIIPRVLAGYEHVLSLKSSIPEKVGFMEMFGVDTTEQLNINARWLSSNPGKSLAVPLGYRGPNDILYLNLHEKAHGPHGLVAGTTGSGKSEIVQSYILALALNFHPYDVGFLLIDYKGGGMANLFKDLPHLLGTITNLDGAASMRALISIKAELKRRQQLFSDNEVNHIDGYQKLFKENKVKEPMPHLFMISDEFAELKSEQPEFMKELVSTARIGRSLGIHLILATQKPSGVVDDQIWSNSKFKLCLKVQNESDSNEMLKTKDAAAITQPGRAYLQVGNNEIYELFQSAYSGAPYMAGAVEEDVRDNRIYEVNSIGQLDLKTQDLSKGNLTITENELEAVIKEVSKTFTKLDIPKVASPWLEPLPDTIFLDDLEPNPEVSDKVNLSAVIGLSDEPQFQAQNTLSLNLEQGHVAIFGLSGFGKSTLIQSMIMSLIKKNTPEFLHLYILDFGGALLPFQNLPFVADLLTIDEEDKLNKWYKIIDNMVKHRKSILKKVGASDINLYEEFTDEKIPRITIIIDNYDALREANLGDHIDKLLVQITREGINLGIHLVLSASRNGALRYNLLSNLKEKTTLFALEKSEISETVGRTSLTLDEIPGRAIIKLADATIYQVALPVNILDDAKRIKSMREYSSKYNDSYKGIRPQNIPVVPEVLYIDDYLKRNGINNLNNQDTKIALGIQIESVEPLIIDLQKEGNLSICYDRDENNTFMLNTILSCTNSFNTYLIDLPGKINELSSFGNYTSEDDETIENLKSVFNIYRSRIDKYKSSFSNQEEKNNINKEQSILLVISGTLSFTKDLLNSTMDEQFCELIENGRKYKIFTIWSESIANYSSISTPLGKKTRSMDNLLLFARQTEAPLGVKCNTKTTREPLIGEGEVNYMNYGDNVRIKFVKK